MPALTRGPLPARVYWGRRSLVLGTAVLLVIGIARLLGGASDASGDGEAAQVAAAATSTAPATTAATPTDVLSDTAVPSATPSAGRPGKRASGSPEPVLA